MTEQVSMEEFAQTINEVVDFLTQLAEDEGEVAYDRKLAKETANVIATMAAVVDELQRRLMTVHYASQWDLTLTRPKEDQ